jgi:hypothetical protein
VLLSLELSVAVNASVAGIIAKCPNNTHKMKFELALAAWLVMSARSSPSNHGILINGLAGTQLYDPFNTPHAQGNVQLGLQTGTAAQFSVGVTNGWMAYFVGSGRTSFRGGKSLGKTRILSDASLTIIRR